MNRSVNSPPMNDSAQTTFAEKMAGKWADELTAHVNPKHVGELAERQHRIYGRLKSLASSMTKELSLMQIASLPIATVITFIEGENKGIAVENLIHAHLISPVDEEAFGLLRQVYDDLVASADPKNPALIKTEVVTEGSLH